MPASKVGPPADDSGHGARPPVLRSPAGRVSGEISPRNFRPGVIQLTRVAPALRVRGVRRTLANATSRIQKARFPPSRVIILVDHARIQEHPRFVLRTRDIVLRDPRPVGRTVAKPWTPGAGLGLIPHAHAKARGLARPWSREGAEEQTERRKPLDDSAACLYQGVSAMHPARYLGLDPLAAPRRRLAARKGVILGRIRANATQLLHRLKSRRKSRR
jgi:hypothetical protein